MKTEREPLPPLAPLAPYQAPPVNLIDVSAMSNAQLSALAGDLSNPHALGAQNELILRARSRPRGILAS
jgi:hypothetical protein